MEEGSSGDGFGMVTVVVRVVGMVVKVVAVAM